MAKLNFMFLIFAVFLATESKAQFVNFSMSGSNCNAVIGKLSENSQNVYAFSAGHCLTELYDQKNPDKVIRNDHFEKPIKQLVYSADSGAMPQIIALTGTLFASFQGKDFAVFTIQDSVEALEKKGIFPLVIDTSEINLSAEVHIVNSLIDVTASCFTEFKPLVVEFQTWTWRSLVRLSNHCKLGPGWSGAPVISQDSGKLIGIISGGNDSGQCKNDYCEKDVSGSVSSFKGQSYFTSFSFLRNCMANDRISLECLR